ncbi:MAG: hypothetical protein BWY22_01948 [Bacteroidetes bacterium ADurb.Bin217]|nr:MAG: hypothetical protein BWY22_01948 [Bacteroidetes bacterium ADurb.Bin217]
MDFYQDLFVILDGSINLHSLGLSLIEKLLDFAKYTYNSVLVENKEV